MIRALQVFGLDEDEAMLQVGLVTFVVIAGLVGLFLWKKRTGSQGWRVKAPAGVHRAFSFMVWLVFKKVPWKPILIWGPWVTMIAVAGFYGIENWRGQRAWKEVEAELRGRGDELDLRAWERKEIPDQDNFARHPAVRDELGRGYGDSLSEQELWGGTPLAYSPSRRSQSLPNRESGERIDLRAGIGRSGAYAMLGELDPIRTRLDGLAEAAASRPDWQIPWVRWQTHNPMRWEMDPEGDHRFAWWSLFRTRALLRLVADDWTGALADFRSCVSLGGYSLQADGTTHSSRDDGWFAELDELLWEFLSREGVDPDELKDLEPVLAAVDTRRAAIRRLKTERAFTLAVLDYYAGHRGYEEDPMEGVTFVSLTRDWTPGWVEDAEDGVNWFVLRVAPSGWYAQWKTELVKFYDRTLFRPDGVEVERLQVDAPKRLEAARDRLGESVTDQVINEIFAYFSGYWIGEVHERQARIDLMRIALGLERYRKREGGYPESLGALVPDFLPALPSDPFTEEAYHYRIKKDGTPLLWSVGENEVDDGGVPVAKRRGHPQLDVVWQYSPTEETE